MTTAEAGGAQRREGRPRGRSRARTACAQPGGRPAEGLAAVPPAAPTLGRYPCSAIVLASCCSRALVSCSARLAASSSSASRWSASRACSWRPATWTHREVTETGRGGTRPGQREAVDPPRESQGRGRGTGSASGGQGVQRSRAWWCVPCKQLWGRHVLGDDSVTHWSPSERRVVAQGECLRMQTGVRRGQSAPQGGACSGAGTAPADE